MQGWKRARFVLVEIYREWFADNATQLAAAVAFFAIFSTAPLLLLSISAARFFFGGMAASGRIVEALQNVTGRRAAEAFQEIVQNASRDQSGVIATILSLVLLLFAASGVFRQLKFALNEVWGVPPRKMSIWKQFLRDRVIGVAMVTFAILFIIVSIVASALLSRLEEWITIPVPGEAWLWRLANFGMSFVLLTLGFALVLKLVPDIDLRWRHVWLGAALSSLLFAIGQAILGSYLGRSGLASAYGAASSLVILLIWIYFDVLILLLGAEFTEVWSRGDREVERNRRERQMEDGSYRSRPHSEPSAEEV